VTATGFTIGLHNSWTAFAELFVRYPRPFARMKLTANETAIIIQMLSHKPGYKVTVEYLRANIEGLSRDKCYAALKRLDERDILQRQRLHDNDTGKFTGMHYELMPPPEYRALAEAMQAAEAAADTNPLPESKETDKPDYDPPLPEIKEVETTSENAQQIEQNPSSDPFPHQPDTAQPDTAEPTQRESIKKEIKEEENLSLSDRDARARETETEEPDNNTPTHGGHLLTARQILNAVVDRAVAAKLGPEQREHVIGLVADLLSAGWTSAALRVRLDGKVTAAAYDPYAIFRQYLKSLAAQTPQDTTAPARDPWGTDSAQTPPQDDPGGAPGTRLLPDGSRDIRYSSCGGRDCTGGSGAGRGTGTFRRRINSDDGSTAEYCDTPVPLRGAGGTTTCHPDARRKRGDAAA
jgi:hypothetical protein